MQESLDRFKLKLKHCGLDDEQIADIMDDTYHLAMEMAHYTAQEAVESALSSLARFGEL